VLVTVLGNHDMPRFMNEHGATVEGLNLAHTMVMTMRGTPQLYYGDEIAMKGGGDPDNRRDFPGGFPGDLRSAFTREGRTPEEQTAFEHLRRLGQLRVELEPLRRGELVNLYVRDQQYAFARKTDRAYVIVAINNESGAATIQFDCSPLGITGSVRLVDRLGAANDAAMQSGILKVTLPARSACILTVE
jgi:neopullulanase